MSISRRKTNNQETVRFTARLNKPLYDNVETYAAKGYKTIALALSELVELGLKAESNKKVS